MNYLIYGNEQYLINHNVEEIIKNNSDSLVIRFDGSFKEDPTDEVLSNCQSDSLLGDKTLILFKNPSFLTSKKEPDSYKDIIEYLENPNENCSIVFYSSYASFKSNLKSFKEVSKNCETHYYTKFDDDKFYQYCNNAITKLKIPFDEDAKKHFIQNCGNDLEIFANCIIPLRQYNDNITDDVLNQLTYSSNEFEIFSLVNAIISKDVNTAIKLVKKLKSDESSIFGLMSILSSQLMYLYSVSYYSSVLNNEKDILEVTKTNNPYRLKMAYKTLNKISPKEILEMINRISNLDYEFKTSSTIDKNLLFDIFISSLSA